MTYIDYVSRLAVRQYLLTDKANRIHSITHWLRKMPNPSAAFEVMNDLHKSYFPTRTFWQKAMNFVCQMFTGHADAETQEINRREALIAYNANARIECNDVISQAIGQVTLLNVSRIASCLAEESARLEGLAPPPNPSAGEYYLGLRKRIAAATADAVTVVNILKRSLLSPYAEVASKSVQGAEAFTLGAKLDKQLFDVSPDDSTIRDILR